MTLNSEHAPVGANSCAFLIVLDSLKVRCLFNSPNFNSPNSNYRVRIRVRDRVRVRVRDRVRVRVRDRVRVRVRVRVRDSVRRIEIRRIEKEP